MRKLSTAAWVVLNKLGAGACFGGKLFDKFALNPSVGAISRGPNAARSSALPGTTTSPRPRRLQASSGS